MCLTHNVRACVCVRLIVPRDALHTHSVLMIYQPETKRNPSTFNRCSLIPKSEMIIHLTNRFHYLPFNIRRCVPVPVSLPGLPGLQNQWESNPFSRKNNFFFLSRNLLYNSLLKFVRPKSRVFRGIYLDILMTYRKNFKVVLWFCKLKYICC